MKSEPVGQDGAGEQTKREAQAMKVMRLGYRGNISTLDAEGQSLLWRSGDLRARLLLNDLSRAVYVPHSKPECAATSTMIHAERYLADRLAYELHPWPKGMVKDETVNPMPERCPHCNRLIIEANWCSQCKAPFCSLNCTLDHKHAEKELNETKI